MLIIRNEQMQAFAQDRVQQFEQRVAQHLRTSWGPRCAALRDPEILQSIREAAARARAHGLTRVRDVVRYIELGYRVGPAFEASPPWVGEILRSDRHPARKMDEIDRRLKVLELVRAAGSAAHE